MALNINKGDVFGSLTLISSFSQGGRVWWVCACECGREVRTDNTRLKKGVSTQCVDCGNIESGLKRRTTHDFRGTKEYRAWANLKNRCDNPKYHLFHRYGGRGISYFDGWIEFDGFFSDMGKAPTRQHSIDRTDNDKGYCAENCKWSTPVEQSNNTSTNRVYEYKGVKNTMTGWCNELGLDFGMVRSRLDSGKYTVAQAFESESGMGKFPHIYTTPDGEFKTIPEVRSFYKKRVTTLRDRFNHPDWPDWIKTNRF